MKKKIIIAISIIVSIIVAIAIIFFGYAVIQDLNQEGNLKKELEEISELVNNENIDTNELNKRLESTIATGDYKIVEEAFKNYIKDSLDISNQIVTLLSDEKISDILTSNNYTNDGPDFVETKQFIKNSKEKLENCKKQYIELLTEEKAMSYIKNKELDSYYIDFYRDEIIGDVLVDDQDKTVENTINSAIDLLESSDKVIDLLISNKGSWTIQGENIVFNSNKLLNDYNSMLDSIKNRITNEQKNTINKDFGSYEIESGWVENKELSSMYSTTFYVKEGDIIGQRTNSITIKSDENNYKAEEHETFRTAILSQLSTQMPQGSTINANGSNTENGYTLYTFVVKNENENSTTTLYYIISDYKHVLVHETVYGDSSETDNAAKKMINTFKWN